MDSTFPPHARFRRASFLGRRTFVAGVGAILLAAPLPTGAPPAKAALGPTIPPSLRARADQIIEESATPNQLGNLYVKVHSAAHPNGDCRRG
jgi:hypothetical protein